MTWRRQRATDDLPPQERVLLLVFTIGVTGCNLKAMPPRIDFSGCNMVSWRLRDKKEPILGIGKATVWITGTRDREHIVVVWLDGEAFTIRCSAGGLGPTESSATSDGRRIDWKCQSTDGRTITVTINGIEYGLAKGCLFLVSLRERETRVGQLHRDTSRFELDREARMKMANDDTDIGGFFKEP